MKKRIPTFLAGVLAATLAFSLGLTAMAASGNLSFNQFEVYLNSDTIITREDLTLPSGAKIPSSILYTDINGGGTVYLPLRKMSEAIGTSCTWFQNEGLIFMQQPYIMALLKRPLNKYGADGIDPEYLHSMREVPPIASETEPNLLVPMHHQMQSNFETELPLDETKGEFVSVTVTNDSEYPVEFQLGMMLTPEKDAKMIGKSMIPAYSTVTRTMQLLDGAKENIQNLYVLVGYEDTPFDENDTWPVDITIEAVQFDK